MSDKSKEISLHLENDVASAMITMFGQLGKVESRLDVQVSEDRKSLKIKNKDDGELIEFNFEYKSLKEKVLNWLDNGQEWLHLDSDGSKLFRECSHAAYYHMTETTDHEQLKRSHFIKFHERLFKI
jgi:hypothetical protein